MGDVSSLLMLVVMFLVPIVLLLLAIVLIQTWATLTLLRSWLRREMGVPDRRSMF